jgi:flagellar biosynthesis/type III secretory pathway protein FliH
MKPFVYDAPGKPAARPVIGGDGTRKTGAGQTGVETVAPTAPAFTQVRQDKASKVSSEESGFEKGRREGWEAGHRKGVDSGRKEGYEQGY